MSVTPNSTEPWLEGQAVLILCGLIASGKSTFAQELERHYPQFRRCNQDELGDRRRVERLARETLAQGLSVCIDRTNFNVTQRSYWIEIAREFPGTSIWVIVFDTPYHICAARLQTRTFHPTIKNPEQGTSVLSRFAADFEQPSPHEGYDRVISLKHTDHLSPVYSRSDIAAILRRVYDSFPDRFTPIDNNPQSFREGRSFRGNSIWGHSFRNNPGSSNNRGSQNHDYMFTSSLNPYPPWYSRGNRGWRGTGRGNQRVGMSPLQQNKSEQRKPSVSLISSAQPVVNSEVEHTGNVEDTSAST
ncbi:P-loop containing nucleoside triphosphate hydrolase protein [Collybia nuda]|uniref:P-loop containing nucleoside triphosphate hydrolase protein n=1 Tax=Collybia nuda TaxID=64659 RepID=A0A9P6CEG3_9AGAR|nr:P-loop containing nucleoside triphosphate hydrolase protein [Collybia nuda]